MDAPHLRLRVVRTAFLLGAAGAFGSCGGSGSVGSPIPLVGFTPGPVTTVPVLPFFSRPHTLLDAEVGDHDADGTPDLAWLFSTWVVAEATFRYDAMAGAGDGSFGESSGGAWTSGLGAAHLAAGDVLGAGAGGFAVATETLSGLVKVQTFGLRRDASGTRGVGGSDQRTGTLAGFAVGDVSGDGIDDVVIADAAGAEVVAWISLGESGLAAPHATALPVGLVPTGLAAGSLTGDALDDVVVLLGSSGYVVLASGGNGFFVLGPVVPLGAGRSLREAVTGDFDGDGRADLACVVAQPGEPDGLGVLFGNGDGTFAPPAFTTIDATLGATPLAHLHAGDIDGDGRDDLAFVAPAHHRVVVAFSAAAGRFTFAADADLSGGACDTLGVGDVNLDGDLDLLVGDAEALTIRVLFNDRR